VRSPKQESITVPAPPEAVFHAALGVAQNSKSVRILAVHNEGRKLVLREKAKLSNPKFHQIYVDGSAQQAQLNVVVGSDPRTPKAMMDGRANERSLKKFVESVRGARTGVHLPPPRRLRTITWRRTQRFPG
jgi:hypothetical protein